jgi:hypothetical protein
MECLFAERAMRTYAAEQKSSIHLHLTEVMEYAVTQVFGQVRPPTDKPYGGDVKTATDAMKRVAFDVFDIRYIDATLDYKIMPTLDYFHAYTRL